MRQLVNISKLCVLLVALGTLCNSCSRDMFDDHNITVIKNVLNDICVEWGTDTFDVSERMDGYDLMEMTEDFMMFHDKETGCVISYLFDEDGLSASSAVIDEDSGITPDRLLSDYDYVGQLSGKDVYCLKQKNLFVTSYSVNDEEELKLVVGMTRFQ